MLRGVSFSSMLLVLLTLLVAGCSPTRQEVKTVKVSGAVKLNGKPLPGAEVNFLGADYAGITQTDDSGNYTIDAQPGENTVSFKKFDGEVDPTMSVGDTNRPGGGPKQLVPKKYTAAETSDLKHTVPDSDATGVDFDLK